MRKNLFLYLALACFAGLLAIFVFDGYIGLYDTLYVTAGEREERIDPDFWLRQGRATPDAVKNAYYVSANWKEKIRFRYEIDNRRFSSYNADIEVTAWRSQQKLLDMLSQQLAISAFDKEQLEWVLDTAELLPDESTPEQSYEYTVTINMGEMERNLILYINPSTYPLKTIPVPRD